MGTRDETTPVRSSKPTSTNQETPVTPAYPDWPSSMQAYYGAGVTPPFFASNVGPPSPHPYLWGSQHPLMPPYGPTIPYGNTVPYPAIYPGGVYAHPHMAMAPLAVQSTIESDAKAPEGKDRTTNKKFKGPSGKPGLTAGKAGEGGKSVSGSGNNAATQSSGRGSEGSLDGSDEKNNHELSAANKGSYNQMLADGATAQNNTYSSVPGNPVVTVPATNLNIGMELWNPSSAASGSMKMHPNHAVLPVVAPGMLPGQWVQDERELKRQKRKLSNRESARRSRLRKQAECEELQQRVDSLYSENCALRDELQRLSGECEKLTSENSSIKEELGRLSGPEAVSKLESNDIQSHGDEHDS